jgi:hypothetical protein
MKRDGLWADAIAKAEAALKQTTAADQVAILTFDDQVRTLVSFEQWVAMNLSERTALAAQRLAASKPTWHATHLGNALIAAAETIEDAEKREQHTGLRRIVLIADLQEGSRLDGLQGHEWPRGLEVVVEPVQLQARVPHQSPGQLPPLAPLDDELAGTGTAHRSRGLAPSGHLQQSNLSRCQARRLARPESRNQGKSRSRRRYKQWEPAWAVRTADSNSHRRQEPGPPPRSGCDSRRKAGRARAAVVDSRYP